MPARRIAIFALGALFLLLTPISAQAETALSVVPHGAQPPGVPWANSPGILPADTQARMYDRITPRFRTIGPDVLTPSADGQGFFKSAALRGADDPALITTETVSGNAPGAGAVSATVRRDAYGVPHIFSATDAGAIFASGYVAAVDQQLLITSARNSGVAALIDLPGVPAITLTLGLYDYKPSAAVRRRVTAEQTRAIRAKGAEGRQLLADIDTYIAGANLRASQTGSPPLTRTDIYAMNAIKAQFLGEGGGQEVENAQLLAGLQQRLGRTTGARAYSDLRASNDPEAATTTDRSYPYQGKVPAPGRGRGEVGLRAGSFRSSAIRLPGGAASAATAANSGSSEASNIMILSGRRSATGKPLFVGGPQIGFNYPGLTYELQISSPSIQVRGASSAPFPGYMMIGRGRDFGWTLTSASVDIIDTYAEQLCGGSQRRYMYNGRCRNMTRVDAGTISKGGKSVKATYWETIHGPVAGYARDRSGRSIALTKKRSSRGRETLDLIFNQRLTYGRVRNARDFIAAAAQTPQTFNSFYASSRETAFYTAGALPLRPAGVNPDLPTNGNGRYEWRGELAARRHPQVVNPSSGMIVNWNNKPARDFPAGDDRFGSEGGIQRVRMLERELSIQPQQATIANVLAAENAAASQDIRIIAFWPTLRRMLAVTPAPTARARQVVAELDRWRAAGGSRMDADGDGRVDAPGAVILDAAWTNITNAGICKRLGGSRTCRLIEQRIPRFSADGQYSGWHQYMDKDLRTILGGLSRNSVRGKYSLRYCGNGDRVRCSRDMWRALDDIARRLSVQLENDDIGQGPDISAWRTGERWINFTPLPLLRMHYSNKPTGIQQVLEFD